MRWPVVALGIALSGSLGCAQVAPAPGGRLVTRTTPRAGQYGARGEPREVRWTPDEGGLVVDGALVMTLDRAGRPAGVWRPAGATRQQVGYLSPEAISPDGKLLVAMRDAEVVVWALGQPAALRTIAAPPIASQDQQRCVVGWRDATRPMVACADMEQGDHACLEHDGKAWLKTPCPAAEFHQYGGWRHGPHGALLVNSGAEGGAAWSVEDPRLAGAPDGAGYPALVVWPEGVVHAALARGGELVWVSDCDWSLSTQPCQLEDEQRRWRLWRAAAGSAPLAEGDVPAGADVAPGRDELVWAQGQRVCMAPVKRWSAPDAQRCFDLPPRTP